MANPEHLAALRNHDAIGWSNWRHQHPGRVDLREADLRDLIKWPFDLSGTDLTGADLSGVHRLTGDFSQAILKGAKFRGAYFGMVRLMGRMWPGQTCQRPVLTGPILAVRTSPQHT